MKGLSLQQTWQKMIKSMLFYSITPGLFDSSCYMSMRKFIQMMNANLISLKTCVSLFKLYKDQVNHQDIELSSIFSKQYLAVSISPLSEI